ncbi:hypothetical protein O9993_03925 [Vibrio lentus]|nr:hypothetical protein [Vibrio lentus]
MALQIASAAEEQRAVISEDISRNTQGIKERLLTIGATAGAASSNAKNSSAAESSRQDVERFKV